MCRWALVGEGVVGESAVVGAVVAVGVVLEGGTVV